ncbi:GNAT family N-acetyltransferase [Sporosarcina limicola]|uniref:GNAT superfamily N-acetyltransferase n=1 Tax=Sporosarcina limicola TaxID=34101 RepID=A0A927MMK8_9BACL|nr:GNAT family N-acetyltransferase [Sporosarcina limicola]MBE1556761.1 GNAT superfamily N-acetyltransferase [Sporosarcina limicola]
MEIIKELTKQEELLDVFSVIKQLRPQLDPDTFIKIFNDANENESYRMFALYSSKFPVAVIGFRTMTTLHNGKLIWINDLVTDSAYRSKGYGEKLLLYVIDWARENGYTGVSLSSGVQRLRAHSFYEDKMNFEKSSFVYKKLF